MRSGWNYLRFGYRVRAEAAKRGRRHFIGGKPHHASAVCQACNRPLLLLWDIDCTDPLFKREAHPVFGRLARLPLYYCWTCARWLAYQVTASRFTLVARDPTAAFQPDFPYRDYPKQLPRVSAVLEPIPADIEKICLAGDEVDPAWLTPQDHKRFAAWSDAPRFVDLHRQQLGGLPHLERGHERHPCPNKKCDWAKTHSGYAFGGMKELASIHNDPGNHLPLIEPVGTRSSNEWVQVVFWICPGCLTIRADQRCD